MGIDKIVFHQSRPSADLEQASCEHGNTMRDHADFRKNDVSGMIDFKISVLFRTWNLCETRPPLVDIQMRKVRDWSYDRHVREWL